MYTYIYIYSFFGVSLNKMKKEKTRLDGLQTKKKKENKKQKLQKKKKNQKM